jgi:DNA-binding MarR family transcriptional regulator
MNVEEKIKSTQEIPLKSKSVINLLLAGNAVSEAIKNALKPFDISLEQFNVLRILRGRKGEAANMATINERMITKMSNTTRLVDKLIDKRYVKRIVCPNNRRMVEIYITDLGLAQLNQMDLTVSQSQEVLLNKYTLKELEQLNTLLNKL